MPASEHYPWTDEQVKLAMDAANRCVDRIDLGDAREILRGFSEVGITVTFPSYWVKRDFPNPNSVGIEGPDGRVAQLFSEARGFADEFCRLLNSSSAYSKGDQR